MSKIKLVAMDLDNTLLDSEKQISKHTEEVLKEAIRRGVYKFQQQDVFLKQFQNF